MELEVIIAATRSNYSRKMRKMTINRPFWIFFQPLLNLSENWLLVTCITDLKMIHEKLFKLSRPQCQIIDVKCEKIAINRPFEIFSAIIELAQELLINNKHNKFEENTWKTFQVIAPTRSNYWRKMRKNRIKSAILKFFSAIIELFQELLIGNMHNKFEENTWKTFKLSRPQGQIIDVKCEKSQ